MEEVFYSEKIKEGEIERNLYILKNYGECD